MIFQVWIITHNALNIKINHSTSHSRHYHMEANTLHYFEHSFSKEIIDLSMKGKFSGASNEYVSIYNLLANIKTN